MLLPLVSGLLVEDEWQHGVGTAFPCQPCRDGSGKWTSLQEHHSCCMVSDRGTGAVWAQPLSLSFLLVPLPELKREVSGVPDDRNLSLPLPLCFMPLSVVPWLFSVAQKLAVEVVASCTELWLEESLVGLFASTCSLPKML